MENKTLYEHIYNYVVAHPNCTNRDISLGLSDTLDETISANRVNALINKMTTDKENDKIIFVAYGSQPKHYQSESANDMQVHHMKKDKNLLYFYNASETKACVFDFNTNEFVTRLSLVGPNYYELQKIVEDIKTLPEWIFNYIDMLDNYYVRQFKKEDTCPNGYIQWLKDNNKCLTIHSLDEYNKIIKFKALGIPQNFVDVMDYMDSRKRQDIMSSETKLSHLNDVARMINKSACVTIKQCYYARIERQVIDLLNYYGRLETETFISNFDTNRDLDTNINNMSNIVNAKLNGDIAKNLTKLNFLNGLTFENYVVVVPQNVQDLQNEGKQQNNCVGHYYNNSIAKGENLIYFLRKVDNPTKSMVTCRYNIYQKNTCEYRRVNNTSANKQDEKIVDLINKLIRENLK